MKGYGQFCPVAKAAEIVAERWTPLVLRLIRLEGPRSLVRAFPTWLKLSGFAGVERVGAAVAALPA